LFWLPVAPGLNSTAHQPPSKPMSRGNSMACPGSVGAGSGVRGTSVGSGAGPPVGRVGEGGRVGCTSGVGGGRVGGGGEGPTGGVGATGARVGNGTRVPGGMGVGDGPAGVTIWAQPVAARSTGNKDHRTAALTR